MRFYTDGACSQGGTQNGGWAVIIMDNQDNLLDKVSGNKEDTTNNEMELRAFLAALTYASELDGVKEISIYTDSAYIHNSIKQNWISNWKANGWRRPRNKELAHRDIWIEIDRLISEIAEKTIIHFEKVKGHSTNKGNNLADSLATTERDELNRRV